MSISLTSGAGLWPLHTTELVHVGNLPDTQEEKVGRDTVRKHKCHPQEDLWWGLRPPRGNIPVRRAVLSGDCVDKKRVPPRPAWTDISKKLEMSACPVTDWCHRLLMLALQIFIP